MKVPNKSKKNRTKKRIALVMSGGGMKCAYGAGVLDALAEHYGFYEPDIIIAASGSAGNAVYYLAGELNKTSVVWISIAKDGNIFSLLKRPHFDIHYVVETIFRKKFPFSRKILARSKTKLFFPVTRVKDGKLTFLKPRLSENLYPFLKAATAMPFAYGKSVRIKGKKFIDGDFGSNTEDLLRKAVDEGATTIILIDNDRAKDSYVRLLMRVYAALPKKLAKKSLQAALRRELNPQSPFIPPRSVDVITVIPSKKLAVSTLERNPANIRRIINLGYADAVNHPKLEELLKKS